MELKKLPPTATPEQAKNEIKDEMLESADNNTTIIEPIDWREHFLDDHHNCPLCGSELLLTNVTHFVNRQVREEARCESCQVRIRQASHTLQ